MSKWVEFRRERNILLQLIVPLFTAVLVLLSAGWQIAQAGAGDAPNASQTVAAQESAQSPKVVIYLFWGNGCPHCEEARPVLQQIAKRYPGVELKEYEIWYDEQNQELFLDFAARYGMEASGVPTIYIGTKYWVGWTESIQEEVELQVATCRKEGCPDPQVDDIQAAIALEASQPGTPEATTPLNENLLKLPLLGYIDLDSQSLAVSTLLIAFVDGFNPCSLWALSMLMAITLHTGSRRKIFLIGFIFITVTATVYALFIAGLFSFLQIVSFKGWIQVLVALIALAFALINIKDYFWYKEGVSLTISDKEKPGLYAKMRNVIARSDSIVGLTTATVGLAAGVSLVEFSCTSGLPLIWTNLLTANGVTTLTFLGLLLIYLVIYQIDELVIFGTVVVTLRASRLEEKQGRILKLIGGSLMLTLAVVMLVDPNLMNDLGNSLVIFAAAFALALIVLFLHRTVLPAMGIWIGSEQRPQASKKKRRAHR